MIKGNRLPQLIALKRRDRSNGPLKFSMISFHFFSPDIAGVTLLCRRRVPDPFGLSLSDHFAGPGVILEGQNLQNLNWNNLVSKT